MTSFDLKFEEMEKDLIQLALIEMMEIQLDEMDTESDKAIVWFNKLTYCVRHKS